MRKLIYLLVLLMGVVVAVWGVLFATQNAQEVALDFFFVELPAMSVARWLVASFILGGFLGFLISLPVIAQLKSRELKAKRQLGQQQTALAVPAEESGR